MTDFSRDMLPGKRLDRGDNLFSATRAFKLSMQFDGNLVLYVLDDSDLPRDSIFGHYRHPLWASNTVGTGFHCDMQVDGNLVVYDDPTGQLARRCDRSSVGV